MEDNNSNINEVSLKKAIDFSNKWIRFIKKRLAIIIFFGFIGSGLGLIYAINQMPIYNTMLSFALEDEKSTGSGSLIGAAGLASSLGIDLGATGGGAFNGANLIELLKSRRIIEKALLNPYLYNGKNHSLADYFLEVYGYKKSWKGLTELENIEFNPLLDRTKYSLLQDSVLGLAFQDILENKILTVAQRDKKISIINIYTSSIDEKFAKIFTENIAKEVSIFYVETKIRKAKLNVSVIQKQVDSVRAELNFAINEVAVANDNVYNLNSSLLVRKTSSTKRQIDVQANTAVLTQLVTNLEMAKVNLLKETPLIQVIDKPILPLECDRVSKTKYSFLGGLFGVILILGFLIGNFLVVEALKE
jgi:uncharacterized protein involved in exopolysaccharide biosynthesis